MRFFARHGRGPIGLDLFGHQLKAAQLSHDGKSWRVEAAVSLSQSADQPLDASRVTWLRDVLTRQGFKGDQVVLAAPAGKLETEMLELPPRTSGAPMDQIARAELCTVSKL